MAVMAHDLVSTQESTVLIVQDDPLQRLDTATMLKDEGFATLQAANAYRAQLLRAMARTGDDVRGQLINAGHFFPEETPEETTKALSCFFDRISRSVMARPTARP